MARQDGQAAPKRGLRSRKQPTPPPDATCVLCERLDHTMNRYLYTVLHLWRTDPAFRKAFEASKGLCVPHAAQLREMAAGETAFLASLDTLQRENLARIEQELEWFTLKFDYRNTEKPWGNSRDALERAINKLRGKCL